LEPPARNSPRTTLPDLSLPSQAYIASFAPCLALAAVAIFTPSLLVGAGQHFFQAGQSLFYFYQAGLAQGLDPVAPGLFFDFQRGAVRQDDALDLFTNRHELVNADPTLIAGTAAAF